MITAILDFVIGRTKEPSTYSGAAILTYFLSTTFHLAPEQIQAIIAAIAAGFGIYEVFRTENKTNAANNNNK